MSKTVVIIDETGRLVAARGTGSKESDAGHYQKFSKRILGDTETEATLDYGWNSKGKLVISKGGARGEQIRLEADEVLVPGNLTVRGKEIQELIDESLGLAISSAGFKGTENYVTVTVRTIAPIPGVQPKQVCTIGLSKYFIDRIDQIEREIHGSVPSGFTFGDGLIVEIVEDDPGESSSESSGSGSSSSGSDSSDEPEKRRKLSVNIGKGLSWEGDPGARAIIVDTAEEATEDDPRPISSQAVYAALEQIVWRSQKYFIEEDAYGNLQVMTEDSSESPEDE